MHSVLLKASIRLFSSVKYRDPGAEASKEQLLGMKRVYHYAKYM